MSRNWDANENPPRHPHPNARILRLEAAGDLIGIEAGSMYLPLTQGSQRLPEPFREALAEGVAKFIRSHLGRY